MPGYGIASLSVTEQNTLIQRVKNIDPYYSSEVARAFLDQFHYPLENRFSDYQFMLQAVEQSGAGMSLSLIEPGKKDAAGYHSIAGWRVMDVLPSAPIIIPRVQSLPRVQPLNEHSQERYHQHGYRGLEEEEKSALAILKALHPDQDAMTLWRSFNMGGELRQRFRIELMNTGRIPAWAEEHRRTSIDPNNLHRFEHIRQLSNAMLTELIKCPGLYITSFSSSDTLIDSFDRAFLRFFTQSRGYQRNAMGALFRTDIRGVFRGDHRTPYELSQDKYMLGFGDNLNTQHTSGNTLYTSSVYQDAFKYGRINSGGASQFHYGYQDDEEYYSFVDSDDSDDERSEPLRQRQKDGFVYLIDTRGLEAIPVADNRLLNPNNTVTNDRVVAGEIHVSVPLEGISSDRIWLVSSDGRRAVRVSDIAQHDDLHNELRDLGDRTFAGANSDIYDGIFYRAQRKGLTVLDISETTMPGAPRNIRNYRYSHDRRFSGANFAHQIAVVNPNNHEEMTMACRWLSEDSTYRTLVDINGNLYSTNGNQLEGENATLAQKIANSAMLMSPGQAKVRLLFVGKKQISTQETHFQETQWNSQSWPETKSMISHFINAHPVLIHSYISEVELSQIIYREHQTSSQIIIDYAVPIVMNRTENTVKVYDFIELSLSLTPSDLISENLGNHHQQAGAHYPVPASSVVVSGLLSAPGQVERDNVADWAKPTVNRQQVAVGGERKSRVIIQLENDDISLRAASDLAGKHPNEAVIYQRDKQGNLRLVYGEPAALAGALSLFFVGHGRGGEHDAHDNTTLAGYSAPELAAVTQQIHQELRTQFPHAVPENIDKLVLIGCALVNDEKTDGFLFKMAPELLKRGMHPGEIVGYATEIGISRAVSEQGRGRRRYPSMTPERGDVSARNVRVSLRRDETGTRYLPQNRQQRPASKNSPLASQESTLHQVVETVQDRQDISSSDKSLIKGVDRAKERLELSRLKSEVQAEILRLGGTEFRFKRFGSTVDGKTELIFVAKVNAEQRGKLGQEGGGVEKRLTSDSDVFVSMQNKMRQLEPEIAHVDGVSTMNAAFLAMNLLSHRGEQDESPWKKFVGGANLAQIMHGIGQDMGHLVSTVNILSGAGAKAESMLGRLLGGVRFTHAGSVVNVAVDIINLVDAVKDLQQMPEGPQKDFAITRVALAGTQLTVDGTLAVLGVVAGFSPTIASGMAIAGPLSVPFAGVMIGANALVQAMAFNNAHYQVEVSEIIAPFCHAGSQTPLAPTAIARHDSRHQGVVYLEPYVPIQKMRINGNRLSIQLADIRVPEFKNDGSRKRTGRKLSAYPAFGINPATDYQQSTALQDNTVLVLPAALAGDYDFMYDTGAWGRFQGEEIFNRLHQHYGTAFPLTTDWLSAPNDANFIPRATTYIIELDSGTRSFTFQQGQEVKRIPGDDHLGLRAGHLPTPVVDAEHADLLTYEFQGAGGTTFIDLADDARHITIKASSDEQKRHSERWVLDITPDTSTTTSEAGLALVQSQISQLRVRKTAQGAILTLKGHPVNIVGPIPREITLQLRSIALPGVTFKLSLLAAAAQDSPKFQITLAADSIEALSGNNLKNIQQIMQSYFSDDVRFRLNPQVRVTVPLAEKNIASGLLDLTTGCWQVIDNNGGKATHPHLYRSDGKAFVLLGRPDAHITSVAHIEYDPEQQQLYAAGITHPRDNPKTSVSYRYYPHLPENQRYQRIEATYIDEKNGKEKQPLIQLIEEIHSESSQAVIRVNSPLEGLSAEYAWDGAVTPVNSPLEGLINGTQQFFKKIEWEQNNCHFIVERNDSVSKSTLTVIALPSTSLAEFSISRLGADFSKKYGNALSSITLSLQDDTRKIDLLGLPRIPLNVFAHVDTKIVGAQPDTTFFLHSETLPHITFKLTASPSVADGENLKWKLSLYAENREALQGESREKIVRLLQHKKNDSWLLQDLGTSVPYSIGNNPDGEAEGVFELIPLLSSESPAAIVSKVPADSAGMRDAINAFDGEKENLGVRDEVLLPSQRPDWLITARAS